MRLLTSIIAADLVVGLAVFPAGAAFEQVAQAPPASTPPAASSPPPASTPAPSSQPRQLGTTNKVWKGDFDRMLERRMIRVLVPYSRTLFFNDKGRERGITAELVRHWEQYLNKKYAAKLGKRPLTVYIVSTTRDKLLPQVAERPRRHRGRQHHGDRGAARDRRLRGAGGHQARQRDRRRRPEGPRHQDRRRSLRRDRARPQGQQLLRESPGAERALHQGGQAAGEARAPAGRARRRRRHGDGQRGRPGRPDRRRLEGHHSGRRSSRSSRSFPPRRSAAAATSGWVRPQGQPQARRRADGLLHELRQEAWPARRRCGPRPRGG